MKSIYPNMWLHIHPYQRLAPSDSYYVELANRLFALCRDGGLPASIHKQVCLYAAGYLEDQVSGLGLWQGFTRELRKLYGTYLPFYPTGTDYMPDEVNVEDLYFLIWNTWQKMPEMHTFISPDEPAIMHQAQDFYSLLAEAYTEAPENEILQDFFHYPHTVMEADKKLDWLFGHTYLTEPSMLPYIDRVTPTDRFIIPTGPLALFLHEWIDLLGGDETWRNVKGLYVAEPAVPGKIKEHNRRTYTLFTEGTDGKNIVYLDGYPALRKFLTSILKWKDDDSHTLPQMRSHRNFVLMAHPEKGILLAKDICEYIADPENSLYRTDLAQANAFRLLTEETLCPPDLLTYCIANHYLPDAAFPGCPRKFPIQPYADFIARHTLLYYYRGD